MKDLIIRNCNLGKNEKTNILIKNGIIEDINENIPQIGCSELDAENYFVTSPFICLLYTSPSPRD